MLMVLNKEEKVIATLNNESPNACPYFNDIHIESLDDSMSTYEFDAPLEYPESELLVADNYISREDMDGRLMLFTIKRVVERLSSDGSYVKSVYCENSAIDELNGVIVRPVKLEGATAEGAMEYVLEDSDWTIGTCDFLGAASFDFSDYPTGIAALHTIAKEFEGDLVYRVRYYTNGKVIRYIDLLEQRGTDTGKRFEYRKDIIGLTRTEDSTQLATALVGIGKADANGVRMTIASANGGVDWIGDDDALEKYGYNGRHIFGVFESNDAENPTALKALTAKELKKRKRPLLTYEVDVLLLETLADWNHEEVRLGDSVRVLDLTFEPLLVLSARVRKLTRSYTDPTQDKAELGDYKPLSFAAPPGIRELQKQLVSNTGLLEGRELAIHIGPLPPAELDRKWMDTSIVPNVLKRWDGSEWVAAGGEQGPPGPAGETLYTWIKYADDGVGTGLTDNPFNKAYIGIAYNKTVATESDNPSDYTWSLLKGEDGAQGIPGPQGADGRSQYLHIAYANNDTGTLDFSVTDSTNRAYIGTYTDFLEDDSTDPTKYTWLLVKGETGQVGPPGKSNFIYIRYSANPDGNPMTASPQSNSRYIGFVTTPALSAPTSYSDYTWSQYQGPQGIQGIQGLQGPKGDQGIPGPEGTSSYTHIAYATGSSGQNFSTSHFSTATYIGVYVDHNPVDSTNYATYKWTLIKGADGAQGLPGPAGKDGLTPYFHTAWANNSTGTSGFSTTVSLGKLYIGVYTDYTAADSTDPSKYNWTLIKGEQGVQGIQGIQGPPGPDGQSLYTWIKYADTPTSGMSDLPAGKTYIGLAYNKTTPTESTTYSDYTWSLIKGSDGAQGPPGPDGQSLYTWIKYADTPTSGMSDSPAGRKYMGIAYNKTSATESTTYSDYEWSLIEGPQGPMGPQGAAGTSVSGVVEYYLASTASSGVTTSTSGWTTTIQTMDTSKRYLWNYERINFSDGTFQNTTPVIIGVHGATGATGGTGRSITSITERYLATSASTGVTRSTSGWSTTMQATTPTNKYLWNYEEITWSSAPTTTYVEPIIIGVHGAQGDVGPQGPKGDQGIQGPPGANGTSQYVHIRYSAASNGNPMTTTPQSNTAYIGIANTTSSTAPSTNTSYTWSLFKGPTGSQGVPGPAGSDGITTFTWVKYADTDTGSGMADTPSGKRYIGLAFNKTTPTESSTPGDYSWSPLYDNVVVGGRNIIKDSENITTQYVTSYATSAVSRMEDMSSEWGFVNATYYKLSGSSSQHTAVWTSSSWVSEPMLFGVTYTHSLYAKNVGTRTFILSPNGLTGAPSVAIAPGESKRLSFTGTRREAYDWYQILVKNISTEVGQELEFIIGRQMLEKSNVASDWRPAPEDTDAKIDEKATSGDLDALAGLVAGVSSELNLKAGMNELEAMKTAFNERVQLDISDKEELALDLSRIEKRAILAETIAGESKKVTNFIETVITESEEGIFIANKGNSTGILISNDRISFVDGTTEVAYISNQMMQINHGIFVESATIAKFKFELIPGTETLAIQWVGD